MTIRSLFLGGLLSAALALPAMGQLNPPSPVDELNDIMAETCAPLKRPRDRLDCINDWLYYMTLAGSIELQTIVARVHVQAGDADKAEAMLSEVRHSLGELKEKLPGRIDHYEGLAKKQ